MNHRTRWLIAGVLAAAAGACLVGATAEAPEDWEYQVIWFPANQPHDYQKRFNDLAGNGWEYSGAFSPSKESPDMVVFRRPRKK